MNVMHKHEVRVFKVIKISKNGECESRLMAAETRETISMSHDSALPGLNLVYQTVVGFIMIVGFIMRMFC